MRQWNLPKPLIHAAEFHVEPARAGENALETVLVHLAAAMVESGDSFDGTDNWPRRVDAIAWQVTGLGIPRCNDCLQQAEDRFEEGVALIFPGPALAVG